MNVRLLRKVQNGICENPENFHMSWWFSPDLFHLLESVPIMMSIDTVKSKMKEIIKCGTTACIAGWVCILSNRKKNNIMANDFPKDVAQKLLDLTESQMSQLFYVRHWFSEASKSEYIVYKEDPKRRARVVVEYIDKFIEKYDKKPVEQEK